jgi:hypothetical protein
MEESSNSSSLYNHSIAEMNITMTTNDQPENDYFSQFASSSDALPTEASNGFMSHLPNSNQMDSELQYEPDSNGNFCFCCCFSSISRRKESF